MPPTVLFQLKKPFRQNLPTTLYCTVFKLVGYFRRHIMTGLDFYLAVIKKQKKLLARARCIAVRSMQFPRGGKISHFFPRYQKLAGLKQ